MDGVPYTAKEYGLDVIAVPELSFSVIEKAAAIIDGAVTENANDKAFFKGTRATSPDPPAP